MDITNDPTKKRFAVYDTPTTANQDEAAHYIVGNYYQWNTATAGTGGAITSGQATSSICPKGWKLPTGSGTGDYTRMVDAYHMGVDVVKLTGLPLYFVRGGFIDPTSRLFAGGSNYGCYWTSTPYHNSDSVLSSDG